MKAISLDNPGVSCVFYIFGGLSIIIADLQLLSYVFYLRYSTVDGDLLYITLFTCLGGLNCIFVWHVCRLLYMLYQGRYSRCSAASSRVWFYTSLFYLLANVLQIGWFYCLEDWTPLGLSVTAVFFCFVLFVFGTRKLHKLKKNIEPAEQIQRSDGGDESHPLNQINGSNPE